MKKMICLISVLLCLCSVSLADYVVTGVGPSRGEAYVAAMGKAPSGSWEIKNISYYPASGGNKSCTITWTQKN